MARKMTLDQFIASYRAQSAAGNDPKLGDGATYFRGWTEAERRDLLEQIEAREHDPRYPMTMSMSYLLAFLGDLVGFTLPKA